MTSANRLLIGLGWPVIVYSLGIGQLHALPLEARQHEEFFLAAAQSLFAVASEFRLRFTLQAALILFVLFLSQLGVAVLFQRDGARTILLLTVFACAYLILAVGFF